jgi:hypothetical protein
VLPGAPTAPSGLQIENSNPKPCRYERATFIETSNDYWHFRAGSLTNVRVWLRRSIGYLLVGREAGIGSANPNGLRFSPQLTKQCSQVLPPEPIHKNVAHRFARQKNPGCETRRDRLLNLRLLPDARLAADPMRSTHNNRPQPIHESVARPIRGESSGVPPEGMGIGKRGVRGNDQSAPICPRRGTPVEPAGRERVLHADT